MSILFKGNLEEGNYTLIKSTDGWVLKGETSYAGFNFAVRPQGEWRAIDRTWGRENWICTHCSDVVVDMPTYKGIALYAYCPNCGAKMKGADDE